MRRFFINSEVNGYEIETLCITSNQETSDAMIVVHGIGSNYHEVLNVAFNYLENGYNVVVYHQRNTGLTGGDNFTFGLYERFDLEAVADYTRNLILRELSEFMDFQWEQRLQRCIQN